MSIDIITVLTDRNLLGQFLKDLNTWKAWFSFLKAFFALTPTQGDLQVYRKCTARTRWPSRPAKEAWLAIGVRGGKSFVVALLATFLAVFKDYELSPGERGYILIVAPTRKQGRIIKAYLSSFFSQNEFLRPFVLKETIEDIELTNSITISVLASDYTTIRGFTAVAAIVDEVAFLTVEGSRPDIEIIRALRSRLISTGGPLIAISSPYAKRGMLYEMHTKHFGKDDSPFLVWQASSLTMNPTLNKDAIEQARIEDPEGARADYDAQFRSDIESFVSREVVESAVQPGCYERPPSPGRHYVAFVDPAGGSGQDSMTLAIAHREHGKAVLDAIRERRPPFSPEAVCEEFSSVLKTYGIRTVYGDRYAGEWPRERFQRHGITYRVSDKIKSDIYQDFLPLINSGQVELLDNGKLLEQLINLERRTGRSGKDTIDHPPRGHDDLCNAACGALVYVGVKRSRIISGARVIHGPGIDQSSWRPRIF